MRDDETLFHSRPGQNSVRFDAYNLHAALDLQLLAELRAGIAELAARILICTFVPSLINGAPIDANASHLAYASVCAADPGAWIAACIVLLIPTINIIIRKRH